MEKKYINESGHKRTQKTDTNVSSLGGRPLTKRLDEARRLYNAGYVTSVALASKMQLNKRSARRYLSRLRELGMVDNFVSAYGPDPGHADTNADTINSFPHSENISNNISIGNKALINVHAQRWRVLVRHKGSKYLKNPNVLLSSFPDGCGGSVLVDCQNDYVLLRSKGQKFWGVDEEDALYKSLDFWVGVLRRLESRLGIVVIKKGSVDMLQTYAEFETSDSVVCEDAASRGRMWRVFGRDGKLRLSTDMSDGGRNHETHSARSAFRDSEVWNEHVNFVLDTPVSFEDLSKMVQFIMKAQSVNVKQIKELSEGLAAVVAAFAKYR